MTTSLNSSEDLRANSFDDEEFKRFFALVPAAVHVITCECGGTPTGVTVSSLVGLSLSPPLVCFNINLRSRVLPFFRRDRSFTANALTQDQAAIARAFSQSRTRSDECLSSLEPWPDEATTRVRESPSTLLLKCVEVVRQGDHAIIIASIKNHHTSGPASFAAPRLVYVNHNYSSLTSERNI